MGWRSEGDRDAQNRCYHAKEHHSCEFRAPKIIHRLSHTPENGYRTCHTVSFALSETHAHHTRRAPSLLAMTSGGHMPAESPAQVEPKMSIAAGMTARAQGQRDHGPARAQAAHVSARADTRVSQRSMRLLRRTCREGHRAPPKVLILVVFAEALQVVSSAPLPSGDSLGLRTRIVRSQVSRTVTIGFMGFGRCGRERALEGVVTLTKGDQRRHCDGVEQLVHVSGRL